MSVLAIVAMVMVLGIPILTDGILDYKTASRDETAKTLTRVTQAELKEFDGRLDTPTTLFTQGSAVFSNIEEECELDNVRNTLIIGARDYSITPDIATVQALVNPKEKVTTWVLLLPHKKENVTDPDISMLEAETINIDFTYPIITYVFKQDTETQVYVNGLNFTEHYK